MCMKDKIKGYSYCCAVLYVLLSYDLSQRLCYVPLPNTFEPHDPVKVILCFMFG